MNKTYKCKRCGDVWTKDDIDKARWVGFRSVVPHTGADGFICADCISLINLYKRCTALYGNSNKERE